MAGISNATFMKAINDGIVKPQLVKGSSLFWSKHRIDIQKLPKTFKDLF